MSTSTLTPEENWARSDKYHNSFLKVKNDALDAALANSDAHGLRKLAISATQGKLLMLLAASINAKRILEVGTLGGYSAIWLGKALPEDGKLVTLELLEEYAQVAKENIANAGLSSLIEVITGPAIESLRKLQPEPNFDLVFIDADKQSNVAYFLEAKRLVRKGGVIIVDNMVRRGLVGDPNYSDMYVEAARAVLELVQGDEEVDAITIPMVGEKGYDGFLYAIRK